MGKDTKFRKQRDLPQNQGMCQDWSQLPDLLMSLFRVDGDLFALILRSLD